MKTASRVVTLGRIGIVHGPLQKITWHPVVAVTECCGSPPADRNACPFHGPVAMLQKQRQAVASRSGKRRGNQL